MISSGFWIVYGTLVVLITGLAALTLYVAQSALRKSFKYQEDTLIKLLREQERHLRKEVVEQMEARIDERLDEGFKSVELRLAEINGKLERVLAKQAPKD